MSVSFTRIQRLQATEAGYGENVFTLQSAWGERVYQKVKWVTLTAEIERRIQALEMRCYRRLLNISYKDHVTNEEVRNRIQNAIGVHDDLLTMVKKWKLRWYGHISRSSGMAKIILQGTVKGARRRGRQKKRWEDNIKEWTGMGFGDSLRAAEDREGWKCNVICGAPTTSNVKGGGVGACF